MSISEIEATFGQEQRYGEEENMLKMGAEVGQHKEGQNMGIRVSAENNQKQLQAAWKLREISTSCMILDHLQAFKLALSNVKEQGWEGFKVHTFLQSSPKPNQRAILN